MSEPAYLAAVRESYDTVAADYVDRIPAPADMDPLGRAMLRAFAEMVLDAGLGPVADVGCGPGRVTAYLTQLGAPAFGVDVSPAMVELARRAHPELRFDVGSMASLDVDDGRLGGVLALFSTFHTPPEHLPGVFAEFHRALAPGGQLLLWTYVGDGELLRPTHAYGGHPVSWEAHLLPAERVAALITDAGLTVETRLLQDAGKRTARPSACLLARKPA